jgi:hypothetical protein
METPTQEVFDEMLEKTFYTIDWDKLIHKFNEENVSQLTQTRIAKLYNCTTATISLSKHRPMSMLNIINLYSKLYYKHFESTIPLNKLLTIKSKQFKKK